jgi:outer membrane protein assembly factor BamE (lipoprotein component of BamABCDE complex)
MCSSLLVRSVLTAALMAALPLAGFALAEEIDQLNMVEPNKNFSRVWRDYPDMDAVFARDGTARSVAQVRHVAKGQSKKQLVQWLGRPVSASQDGGWNFVLKLPLPQGNALVCQYRVYFDEKETVKGTIWRRPQCADLVASKQK